MKKPFQQKEALITKVAQAIRLLSVKNSFDFLTMHKMISKFLKAVPIWYVIMLVSCLISRNLYNDLLVVTISI